MSAGRRSGERFRCFATASTKPASEIPWSAICYSQSQVLLVLQLLLAYMRPKRKWYYRFITKERAAVVAATIDSTLMNNQLPTQSPFLLPMYGLLLDHPLRTAKINQQVIALFYCVTRIRGSAAGHRLGATSRDYCDTRISVRITQPNLNQLLQVWVLSVSVPDCCECIHDMNALTTTGTDTFSYHTCNSILRFGCVL